MAKKTGIVASLLQLSVWLTGVLVSLAVGFGMIDGVLMVKWIPLILTVIAGWIVVVLTIVGAVLALFNK
jgi:hypothetical protein